MKSKVCSKCEKRKSCGEFYANKHNSDGLHSYCKECYRKDYQENRSKILAYQKKHYKKNKDKIKRYVKKRNEKIRFGRLRQEVLERDNYLCQLCGKTHHETILHIHHKDGQGRYSVKQNNDINNLVTYCVSCHLTKIHKRKRKGVSNGVGLDKVAD